MKSVLKKLTVVCCFVMFSFAGLSQNDTLHLYYHHTQIKPHDTIAKKIEKWAKSLSGKHVDIRVVAYYHKIEFKKFSEQRLEELFLELNRKARNVITIKDQSTKKGKEYQRTMVDIIYTPTLSEADRKAKEDAEKAEAMKLAEAKKAEKAAKDSTEKAAKGESEEKKSKSKTDVAKEQTSTAKKDNKAKDNKDKKKADKGKAENPLAENGAPGSKPAGKGLYATQEDVTRIKAAQIVVPRTDNPGIDSMLTEAVKEFWKFNTNITFGEMTYKEAKAQAKTNKNLLIFIVTSTNSESLTHGSGASTFRYVSQGSSVMLEDGKGKPALAGYFPTYGEEGIVSKECLYFAVSVMNSLMTNLDEKQIKNNMTVNKPYKHYAPKLKDETLVIPEDWLTEKLEVKEIGNYYKGKYAVADYKKYRAVILEKQNYAYTMVVPVPQGGNFVYQHYLMDASNGKVFFVSQPKMAMNVYGANITKSNTGLINSKNLEKYNDAFEGGGDEEEAGEEKSDDKGDKAASESAGKDEAKKDEKKSKGKSKKSDETTETSDVEKEVKEEVKKEEKSKKKKEDKKTKKTDEEKTEETKAE